jgi:hypothetical protein
MLISLPDQWNSVIADAILELHQSQFIVAKSRTFDRRNVVESRGLSLRPCASQHRAPAIFTTMQTCGGLAEKCRFRLTPRQTARQTRIVFAPAAPEVRGDRHEVVTWRQRPNVAVPPAGEHLQPSLPTSSVAEAPAHPIASKTKTRKAASAFAPL